MPCISNRKWCKQTLFYCALLYQVSQMLCFFAKWKQDPPPAKRLRVALLRWPLTKIYLTICKINPSVELLIEKRGMKVKALRNWREWYEFFLIWISQPSRKICSYQAEKSKSMEIIKRGMLSFKDKNIRILHFIEELNILINVHFYEHLLFLSVFARLTGSLAPKSKKLILNVDNIFNFRVKKLKTVLPNPRWSFKSTSGILC